MRALPGFRCVCCLLLAAFLSHLTAQQIPGNPAQSAPTESATTITAIVTGHDHHPVTGLKAEDFTLYAEGHQQLVTLAASGDVPACIGLMVDQSGSMRRQLGAITSALEEFVRAGNPANQVFVACSMTIRFCSRISPAIRR